MEKTYKHNMPYNDGWKMESGSLPVELTNDYLFRLLLQADEKTLQSILASVLRCKKEDINDLCVINPVQLGDTVGEKELQLDVYVKVNDVGLVDLEMQVQKHKGWIERSVIYVCRDVSNLQHGDAYDDWEGLQMVAFVDFTQFSEHPEFHSEYGLINKHDINQLYTDKLWIHNVNLKRIDLATEQDKEYGLDLWARFFKAKTWEELRMLADKSKDIEQAASSVWQLTEDEIIQERIYRRNADARYYDSRMQWADEVEKKYDEVMERISEAERKNDELANQIRVNEDKIRADEERIRADEEEKSELERQLKEAQEMIAKLQRGK